MAYFSPIKGYESTSVVITFMDRDKAYDYFLDKFSFSFKNAILTVLGFMPDYIGKTFAVAAAVDGTYNSTAVENVKNAGGYIQIINTYNNQFNKGASVTTGWKDYTYMQVPDGSTNVNYTIK